MYLSYIANKIVNYVVERLGVQTNTLGFESETDMVKSLTAIESQRDRFQTCSREAGNIVTSTLSIC